MNEYSKSTQATVVGVYGVYVKVRYGPGVRTAQLAEPLRPGDVSIGDTVILRHEHDKVYVVGKPDAASVASVTQQTVVQTVINDDANTTMDHGLLFGLEDDDHSQYLNSDRGDARYSALLHTHDNFITEHHDLSGLGDDDHTQYHTDSRGDARYSLLGHSHDHGGLAGLNDDDHSQYHTDARGDVRYAPIAKGVTGGDGHDHSGGDGAQIAHGGLSGLDLDHHSHYLTIGRHDLTARHTLGTVVPHDTHANLDGLDQDDHWKIYPSFLDAEIITGVWRFTQTLTLGSDLMPSTPNVSNIGSSSYPFLSAHISEMWGTRFVEETIQVAGGHWLVPKSSSDLVASVTPGANIIQVRDGIYVTGDFLMFLEPGKLEVMKVLEDYGAGDIGVERSVELPPSDPNYHVGDAWSAGAVFVNLGKLGDGWLEAQGGQQPSLSIWAWNGTTWADRLEVARFGDLVNLGDYGANHSFGVFIGDYDANSWMSYDKENGLRIRGEAIIQGTLSVYAGEGSVIIDQGGMRIGGEGGAAIIGGEVYDIVNDEYVRTGDYGFRVYDYNGIPRIALLALADGAPFFRLGGQDDTEWLEWNDGGLNLSGSITANEGRIGGSAGWQILTGEIRGTNTNLYSAGYMTLGSGNDTVTLHATDATWRLAVGNATMGSAPFRVDKTGKLYATGADISGTIDANAGTLGGLTVDGTLTIGSGGSLVAGGGNVVIDTTSISLSGTADEQRFLRFSAISNGYIGGIRDYLVPSGRADKIEIHCDGGTDEWSEVKLYAKTQNPSTSAEYVSAVQMFVDNTGESYVYAGASKFRYSGNIVAIRSATDHTGYIFVPKVTPITNASYDGNDTLAVGTTTIDIPTVFSGVPTAAKAVLLRVSCKWTSASSANNLGVRPSGGSLFTSRLVAHNQYPQESTFVCPIPDNNDIEVVVAGLQATEVNISVWGYYV